MVWKAMHGKFRQDFLVRMHSFGVIVPQLPTLELHIYFQLNKYAIHLWQTVCLSTVSDGGRFISPKDFEGFSRGIIIFTIDFHMAHYTYYNCMPLFVRWGFVSVSVIVPFRTSAPSFYDDKKFYRCLLSTKFLHEDKWYMAY